jgi:hypothetical protein
LKKDGTAYTFATAKEGDDASRKWELYGLSETSRAAIGRLELGDIVAIQGPIAVRVEYGVPVFAVNVEQSIVLRLPTPPKAAKPKAAKAPTKESLPRTALGSNKKGDTAA